MQANEYQNIKVMTSRLISFIKWKGASLESKQRKVIKEISLIEKYCLNCLEKENPDSVELKNTADL